MAAQQFKPAVADHDGRLHVTPSKSEMVGYGEPGRLAALERERHAREKASDRGGARACRNSANGFVRKPFGDLVGPSVFRLTWIVSILWAELYVGP